MNDLRIGDAEREAAAAALGEHFALGRLTREEYDERSDVVWSARTQADLQPLFADLPAPGHAPPARIAGPVTIAGPARPSRPRVRGLPLFPVLLLLAGLIIALPGPPWPLIILGWLWFAGFFGRGWARHRHWSHR